MVDTLRVDRAGVLRELERADQAAALPRLGGMARADGVVIVSERFWAFAGVDGTLREGRMPRPPRRLRSIPFVRGLVRLSASLSPLFRRTGVARKRERWLLLLAVFAPFGLAFAPGWASLTAGLVITAGLLAWVVRGRTLFLHGAERCVTHFRVSPLFLWKTNFRGRQPKGGSHTSEHPLDHPDRGLGARAAGILLARVLVTN